MRNTIMLSILLLCVAFTTAPATARADPGVVLIAHPGVPHDTCNEKTAQRIFLGKKTRWSGGVAIVPVILRKGDTHEEFVAELLDRSVAKFEIYWKQAVFTGKGIPPRSFATERELLEFVAATPGAVGYVARGMDLRGVKELVCR